MVDNQAIYMPSNAVVIRYTNHRGETADRRIVPVRLWFGDTQWHRESQWLLGAYDLDKGEARDFAVKDIASWRPAGDDLAGLKGEPTDASDSKTGRG